MPLRLLSLLPLLGLCVALPARADLLRAIDARYASGAIDAETRHYYRVAALKDRTLLPPELRPLPLVHARRGDATRIAVEAMQWIVRNQAQGGRLQRLLAPPADLMHVLDSSTLPIRVTYGDTTLLMEGQAVLQAAEQAWTLMTDGWGFYVPPLEPGYDRYRIYIDDTPEGSGAYTMPYAEDPSTPRSDCYSYIVYNPMNSIDQAPSTVAHELSHAMQMAMDCVESATFMENTSTFIETAIDDVGWEYNYGMIEVFQNYPWRALDYSSPGQSDGYEYGGSLWPIYLTSTFAPGNGPVFMRQVWEACIQDDLYNSKDYFQAVREVVAAAGGPADLETVFTDFSEARYFIGIDSDGAHIPGAAGYPRDEVATAARFTSSSLPITAGKPTATKRPAGYGSNHVVLTLNGTYPNKLRVRFNGVDETRWAARVLLVGGGATESLPITLDSASQSGVLEVDPAGRSKLILLAVNLGSYGYSPNDQVWEVAEYYFDIEPIAPPPTLTALVPAEVEQGSVGVAMKLQGQGFVNGADFAVEFDDPTLFVAYVTGVTATEVKFVLTVPGETPLGEKTVIVTNLGGSRTEGPGLLTVVAPRTDAGTGGDDGGGGCGCASGRGGAPSLLLVLVALALFRRRRS